MTPRLPAADVLPAGVVALKVPELGLGESPITLTVWHVKRGAAVAAGDWLVELVAASISIDLPSPATGRMAKLLVREDEPIAVGQTLAWIAADDLSETPAR